MTYNILYGGVGRERDICEVVDTIRPDIAVFTEVTAMQAFDLIADTVGPYRVVANDRRNRERPGIVSRWPIVDWTRHGPPWSRGKWIEATVRPFPPSLACDSERASALRQAQSGPEHGRGTARQGVTVTVHGVHLVPQPLWPMEIWRRQEVRYLMKRLQDHRHTPQIVAGDFNALMPGDPHRREGAPIWIRAQWALQGGMTPRWALQPLIDAGYVDGYRSCQPEAGGFTVPAWDPGARIDYVFASPVLGSALRSAGTLERHPSVGARTPARSFAELMGWAPVRSLHGSPSDHLPVWVDFEWPPVASRP